MWMYIDMPNHVNGCKILFSAFGSDQINANPPHFVNDTVVRILNNLVLQLIKLNLKPS